MRSRYHSCKSSGWKLKYFRHGAESTLLAPIGITRYPFSGKAYFCIAPKDTPRRFSLCRMITILQNKTFSHTVTCTVFLRPEGQIQTTGDTLLAHGGIRTREKRALQAQSASVLLAYTSEHPRAPLWRINSNTGLKVPCKHILPIHIPFFTEKKLRTLIWVRSLAVFPAFQWLIFWKAPVPRPQS